MPRRTIDDVSGIAISSPMISPSRHCGHHRLIFSASFYLEQISVVDCDVTSREHPSE